VEYSHPREWLQTLSSEAASVECFASQWPTYLFDTPPSKQGKLSGLDVGELVECATTSAGKFDLAEFVAQLVVTEAVQTSVPCAGLRCSAGDACMLTGPASSPEGHCLGQISSVCAKQDECVCSENADGAAYADCTIP
jgi:hypothetical protein